MDFAPGDIVYKETIAAPAEGVGHYEPLRHYAEVRLLLEPAPRGTGLRFDSACSTDRFDGHWQRLVLTHLAEKQHLGVLTGSPITDMRITLTAGRAHVKHTEGGDFRQATYRAVRQGLMSARSVLLEPWYDFRLELPPENLGRAMTDVQQMGGSFDAPRTEADRACSPAGPRVRRWGTTGQTVTAYTGDRGGLRLHPWRATTSADNPEERRIARLGAMTPGGIGQLPDSIFCGHGAALREVGPGARPRPLESQLEEDPARPERASAAGPAWRVPGPRPPTPLQREEGKSPPAIFRADLRPGEDAGTGPGGRPSVPCPPRRSGPCSDRPAGGEDPGKTAGGTGTTLLFALGRASRTRPGQH